jgi:hypothetical protein
MNEEIKILSKWLFEIENDLRKSLPKASGETINSLEVRMNDSGGSLLANSYIGALEYGRKPTKSAGSGTTSLKDKIREWVRIKGIDEGLVYAITRKIHKEGTLMYRTGKDFSGRGQYLSNIINERRVENLLVSLSKSFSNSVESSLLNISKAR